MTQLLSLCSVSGQSQTQGSSQLLHSPPELARLQLPKAGKGGIRAGFVPVWDREPRGEWGWGVPAQGDGVAGWEGDGGPASLRRALAGRKPIPNGYASQEQSLLLQTLQP